MNCGGFDLSGKVAVITGGNGGIGLGIARGMAAHGARIVIAARDREKTGKAADLLRASGHDALGLELDIQSEQSVAGMIEKSMAEYGHIDILVNNAGINITRLAEEFSADDWRRIIDTNLIGAYQLCQQIYPHMKSSGGGKIINISSMTAIFGSKRSIPYGASKSGLTALTRSLAVSWAADNIQVNVILPGWVETELTIGLRESEDPEIKHIWRSINDRIPAARWAKPDDIAGAAVFLASAAADYITGAALPVDGGYSIA
jgi:2-deoxy-D-gluconate 3-dehydrogenase